MKKRFIFLFLFFMLFLVSCSSKTDEYSTNKCILTVDYNLEGVELDTIEYEYASLVTLPENNYKNFKGWVLDLNVSEVLDVGFPIYKNETLYAVYYDSTVKEEFNLNRINFKEGINNTDIEVLDRVSYSLYKDITYKVINDIVLKLDIYYPKEDKELKGVIFSYYGGGWVAGSKEATYFNLLYTSLARNGMVIVVPNYRLCNGSVIFPSPVEDCLDAIRYIVKHQDVLDIDVNKMGSIGYSAGGHLALMAAFAQDYFDSYEPLKEYKFKLKFVCDYFGPAIYGKDEFSQLNLEGKFFIASYLGSLDLDNPEYEKSMPSYFLDNNKPDIIIIHGTKDEVVPISQSLILYQRCDEKGMKVKLITVEGANHMLSAASGAASIKPSLLEIFGETSSFISESIK